MKRLFLTIMILLLMAGLAPAVDTARDQTDILALFAAGQPAGSLSPQDQRDFIVSILPATKTEGRLLRFGASEAVGQTTGIFEDGSGNVGIGPGNVAPTGTTDILNRTATTGATEVKIGTDGTNESATTTQLIVRAGTTQGGTVLQIWENAAGADLSWIDSAGNHLARQFVSNVNDFSLRDGTLELDNTFRITWSSTTAYTGANDLGINRNEAGVLGVNSGTAGIANFRDLILRDLETVDVATLANESLTDTGFPDGTNWADVGDFATPAGTAVYTDSANSGTLTQTSAQMAIPGVGNRWYVLTYTISSQSGNPACTITTAFAGSAETLTISDGAQTNYFQSAASPANYIISCTSSSGGFTMDNMSLKEVIGGDVVVNGLITGGGTLGWRVNSVGDLLPSTDNTHDIGASGSAPADLYLAGTTAEYNSQATAGVGQPAILGNISTTGLTAAVTTAAIVTGAGDTAGLYEVVGYMQTTTAAAGVCTSDVTIGWTYNGSAKTLEVVSNHDQNTDETYSQIPPTIVRIDASVDLTYAVNLEAGGGDCGSTVYDVYAVAKRIQ